jgi:hypothetical protein
MNFFEALQTNDTFTENLMPTHSTSGSHVVDLFFKMGGWRGASPDEIVPILEAAFVESSILTARAMFYNRDVRGGQGERRTFRIMFRHMCVYHPDVARKNIELVPFYGRWDDLLVAIGTTVEDDALDYILFALKDGKGLCAKWMPREGKKYHKVARHLMKRWGLSPRGYRKLLAGNTNVVESLMCAKQWGEINYEHVPSVAMKKYRKAFDRNDAVRFAEYLGAVAKGEKKINAGAIFPSDIVAAYWAGAKDDALEVQWKALPNYVPEGQSFIPVCDVSGSMAGMPLYVSIALGIYLSERNVGPFKDGFITFSGRPTLQHLHGDLQSRIFQLARADWDMNTNLEAVFKLILDQGKKNGVAEEDMPENILIISDMQFDQCVNRPSDNAFEMIKRMYNEAGYQLPNVIFWNVRTSSGVPVKIDQSGAALVSGYSPSVMQSVLGGEMNPINVVMRVLESDRYIPVQV